MNKDELKTLLASRITVHANAIDAARKSDMYAPAEFQDTAFRVAASLSAIEELERVWEAVFDEKPDVVAVARASTVERSH